MWGARAMGVYHEARWWCSSWRPQPHQRRRRHISYRSLPPTCLSWLTARRPTVLRRHSRYTIGGGGEIRLLRTKGLLVALFCTKPTHTPHTRPPTCLRQSHSEQEAKASSLARARVMTPTAQSGRRPAAAAGGVTCFPRPLLTRRHDLAAAEWAAQEMHT